MSGVRRRFLTSVDLLLTSALGALSLLVTMQDRPRTIRLSDPLLGSDTVTTESKLGRDLDAALTRRGVSKFSYGGVTVERVSEAEVAS
jgi:hypothetical protein